VINLKCSVCGEEAHFRCKDDAIEAGWNRAIVGRTVLDFCPEHSAPEIIVDAIKREVVG